LLVADRLADIMPLTQDHAQEEEMPLKVPRQLPDDLGDSYGGME
jgi:hypothetical protein